MLPSRGNVYWTYKWHIQYLNCPNYCIRMKGKRGFEAATIPFSTSCVTIAKSIHAIALLTAFMPWSFVAVAISKVINTKTMDFVPKIFSRVFISISTNTNKFTVKTEIHNEIIYKSRISNKNQGRLTNHYKKKSYSFLSIFPATKCKLECQE